VAALTHAVVDAACALLLFGGITAGRIPPDGVMPAFLGYGLLAFGTQPIIGFAADRSASYRGVAVGGAVAVAISVPLAGVPGVIVLAIALSALGNAAFHVGAGAFSLRATPGKALAPGLFVAPGAAGLALGTVAGRSGAAEWPFVAMLALLTLILARALARSDARRVHAAQPACGFAAPGRGVEGLLVLVLLVVVTRSFVGTAVAFPWSSEPGMIPALIAAVVVGKALGGVLADRFGRLKVGAGTLLLSAPLLAMGAAWQPAGIADAHPCQPGIR
jgi:FSR family fosmidomycin resistance protein-like MFS transporter